MISFYLFTLSHELSHMSLAETLPRIFLNPKVHRYSVITTSNSIFLKQQQNFDCLPPKYTQLLCQHATATALVHSPFLGPWVMRFSHCLHILHWLPRHLQHWQSHTGGTALSDISSLSVLNRQRICTRRCAQSWLSCWWPMLTLGMKDPTQQPVLTTAHSRGHAQRAHVLQPTNLSSCGSLWYKGTKQTVGRDVRGCQVHTENGWDMKSCHQGDVLLSSVCCHAKSLVMTLIALRTRHLALDIKLP